MRRGADQQRGTEMISFLPPPKDIAEAIENMKLIGDQMKEARLNKRLAHALLETRDVAKAVRKQQEKQR